MNDDASHVEPGDYREWFPFIPETVIEAAERLAESDDPYETYLAHELADGYGKSPGDLDGYRDPSVEGFDA